MITDARNSQDPGPQSSWPDWRLQADSAPSAAARMSELVRYIDPGYYEGLRPKDLDDRRNDAGYRDDAGKQHAAAHLARQLYEDLVRRRIRYAPMAHSASSYDLAGARWIRQRIRPPQVAFAQSATCLELALLYAGQCLALGLRSHVVVTFEDERHAVVLLDLTPLRDQQMLHDRPAPPGFRATGTGGVWTLPRGTAPAWDDRWLAIDVVQVTQDPEPDEDPFATAVAAGTHHLSDRRRTWWAVDVDARQALLDDANRTGGGDGFRAHVPPAVADWGRLTSQLPQRPAFREYPSRAGTLHRLKELLGAAARAGEGIVVVLQGDRGLGKSRLAHHVATAVDGGYGWFLDGSSTDALTRSLAQREAAERGISVDDEGAPVRLNLAQAAVRRLESTRYPWVVVVDNVDRPLTAEDRELLPRPRHGEQVVLLTTTDPGRPDLLAVERQGLHVVPIQVLEPEDSAALGVPADALGPGVGSPVVLEPLAAMRQRGFAITGDRTGPDRVWEVLVGGRGAVDGPDHHSVLEACRLLAWAPRSRTPTAGLPVRQARQVIAFLAELRLVTVVGHAQPRGADRDTTPTFPVVELHGLLAEAIRRAQDDESTWHTVNTLLRDEDWGRQSLIYAPDGEALQLLTKELKRRDPGPASPAGPQADRRVLGLAWHGLGSARERRGPVARSKPAFDRALDLLDADQDPLPVAECLAGLVRIAYQARGRFPEPYWREQQARIRRVQELIGESADLRYLLIREAATATHWLIERTHLKDSDDVPAQARLDRRQTIHRHLLASYHRRLVLTGTPEPDGGFPEDHAPPLGAPMIVDRAYYNLAGSYLGIAQARAARLAELDRDDPALLRQVSADLGRCRTVYEWTAELRRHAFGGGDHPHLAACINGIGIAAYYRAVLLGDWAALVPGARQALESLENRYRIRTELDATEPVAGYDDEDVAKSLRLVAKTFAVVSVLAARAASARKAEQARENGKTGPETVDRFAEAEHRFAAAGPEPLTRAMCLAAGEQLRSAAKEGIDELRLALTRDRSWSPDDPAGEA